MDWFLYDNGRRREGVKEEGNHYRYGHRKHDVIYLLVTEINKRS